MSLVEERIRLSLVQIFLLSILSTTIAFSLVTSLDDTNNKVSFNSFELQIKYLMLIIVFLTTATLSYIFSKIIKFNTYELHDKWERKNPDAERIFDQTILELYNDLSPIKKKISIFVIWFLAASSLLTYSFPLIALFIPHLPEQQKIIIILASILFLIPIIHIMAFIQLTATLGHKRIYYQNKLLLSREAFVFMSIGGFKQKPNNFVDMEYKEDHGKGVSKYTLKLSGWSGIIIASSTNFEKIDELRKRIIEIVGTR